MEVRGEVGCGEGAVGCIHDEQRPPTPGTQLDVILVV